MRYRAGNLRADLLWSCRLADKASPGFRCALVDVAFLRILLKYIQQLAMIRCFGGLRAPDAAPFLRPAWSAPSVGKTIRRKNTQRNAQMWPTTSGLHAHAHPCASTASGPRSPTRLKATGHRLPPVRYVPTTDLPPHQHVPLAEAPLLPSPLPA